MSRIHSLVALLSIAGCAVDEDSTDMVDQATISPNTISPNTISPNTISPNTISPNGPGVTLNSVQPHGVAANGAPIEIAATGAPLVGAGLVGSQWTGVVSDGTTVALRIDAAQQGTGANADLWSYRMSGSYDGTWRPLCVDPDGNEILADSVRGTWNLNIGVTGGGSYLASAADFTIACRGSAIAKCVELGYKPWDGQERALAACTRAMRGDYCGDGTPYTVTGTMVNIYDRDGIQGDSVAWDAEAEWTPSGARCVSKKKETRFSQAAGTKPWCYPHAVKPSKSCGTSFSGEAVIITELPPL